MINQNGMPFYFMAFFIHNFKLRQIGIMILHNYSRNQNIVELTFENILYVMFQTYLQNRFQRYTGNVNTNSGIKFLISRMIWY